MYDNFVSEGFRKGKTCKIINAFLSYILPSCSKCGSAFESNKDFEKKEFDKGSFIVLPSICKMDAYLFLKKQRIKCLHCNCLSVCKTNLVNYACIISNNTKQSIAVDLIKKRSEKNIAIDNNVLPNTVQMVIDSYYEEKNYINIVYPRFSLLMSLSQLNPLKEL